MPAKLHLRCLHCGYSLADTRPDETKRLANEVRDYPDGSGVVRGVTRERYTCPRCGKSTTRDTRKVFW
jgi:rubredoxin